MVKICTYGVSNSYAVPYYFCSHFCSICLCKEKWYSKSDENLIYKEKVQEWRSVQRSYIVVIFNVSEQFNFNKSKQIHWYFFTLMFNCFITVK